MFTGIIYVQGVVSDVMTHAHGKTLTITASSLLSNHTVTIGASIACNGACMTATSIDEDQFTIDVSPESLAKTTIGNWEEGQVINLEASLKLGDELGGHMVSGHVDGVGSVAAITEQGDYILLDITIPDSLIKYAAPKGSMAIDGVSLTIVEQDNTRVRFAIIPHTWEHTIMNQYQVGTKVNVEVDLIARYVAQMVG